MAKFKTLTFCQKVFLWHQTSHADVQCVYTVYAKYQVASVKAPVQADFHVHVLPKHYQNPY